MLAIFKKFNETKTQKINTFFCIIISEFLVSGMRILNKYSKNDDEEK